MILDRLGKELLFFDGGMGTLLQEGGLKPGELPETWNLSHPEIIREIHKRYMEAGSDIILTNTFGANALKFHDTSCTLEEIVQAAVGHVREARKQAGIAGRTIYTALDIGPTGKLLKPMGDLEFEKAYEAFAEVMRYGEEAGADLIHIETMSDTYELKAAVLAARENTGLPVFVTTIFDERGKLLTGADVPAVTALLEGLGVDALGINMMYEIVQKGASVIGGCCGTTPEHIKAMVGLCQGIEPKPVEAKEITIVSSYGQSVCLGQGSKIIGERINPTGKKRFKQALKDHDIDYILKEGIIQQEKGAHILDVNVGLPDIDEAQVMQEVVTELQSVTSLPLQIDTVDIKAMERALRVYNGKPMVNSVSGKQESMDAVFPLIQKYGGVVIGLTLDERGIPGTADGRVEIARRIITEAAKYGIQKKDIVIDVLAMTISSEPEGAAVTLKALQKVRYGLGVHTVLGVSNISFGLPSRPVINANFYTMAMQSGLSAGIINPSSEDMMKSYYAYHALMNLDNNCSAYIAKYSNSGGETKEVSAPGGDMSLQMAIEKGLREEAQQITGSLVREQAPLEIINTHLIPALDQVGKGFEKGSVFLPQLLMSAEAAKAAFAVLKEKLAQSGGEGDKKDKVILATVKGDIHDIGKNIVKVLLENYSFEVIDLGKDVPPEKIVDTAVEQDVRLVGLSALMTTTVVSMEETIRLLREQAPGCSVMVGGAVLNQEYADMIGADFYGKDAMQSVYYAQRLFKEQK